MPKDLPEKVKEAVKAIRRNYGRYVEVKNIKGRLCLFESTSIYDRKNHTSDKITSYLGWFTEDGLLIPAKKHRGSKTIEEIREERLEELGILEEQEKEADKQEESARREETAMHERKILMAMSMNSRITLPELAKITGLKETAVNYHIRRLEKRYDIKYLLEVDIEKFGYMNYIAFIKFKDKKPKYDQIKEQLDKIPNVQVAMTVKGICDIALFMVIKNTSEARFTLYNIRNNSFPEYDAEWNMMPAYQTFGFIPLRNQFFDVLKEKAWKRTRENPRPSHDQITEIEYKVLKAMNSNAGANFSDIDNEIGTERGRSNYAYHQLTKRGIIKRSTISMQNIHEKYSVIFLLNKINSNGWLKTRDKLLLEIISKRKEYLDKYTFTCDTLSPDGGFLIMPVMEDDEGSVKEDYLNQNFKGISVETITITNIFLGDLNSRLFDKTETRQYEILISNYQYKPEEIVNNKENDN